MDTYLEQLVKIKLDGKAKWMIIAILAVDLLLTAGLIFLALLVHPLLVLVILGAVGFGTFKLLSMLSVEFEYIITNGDLDIDKITAKSTRKRMQSIKLSKVEKYGKYNGQPAPGSVANTYFFCDRDSKNAVYLIAPEKGKGNMMVVLDLDERMQEAAEKFIPRTAK
jgi:hypothetical protein